MPCPCFLEVLKPLASLAQPLHAFHKLVILAVEQPVDRNEYIGQIEEEPWDVAFVKREVGFLEFAVSEGKEFEVTRLGNGICLSTRTELIKVLQQGGDGAQKCELGRKLYNV
jgi:hypothetical protein